MPTRKTVIAVLLPLCAVFAVGGILFGQSQSPSVAPGQSAAPSIPSDLFDMPPPIDDPEMIDMNFMIDFMRPLTSGRAYIADTEKEITQTLPDGMRISRKTAGHVARDAQGRTWRESGVSVGPNPAGTPQMPEMIMIVDLGAHAMYTLMPSSKMAIKMVLPDLEAVKKQATDTMKTEPSNPPPSTNSQAQPASQTPASAIARNPFIGGKFHSESLGEKNLEGVIAQGKRFTAIIPAGEIGNDRPIEVVAERWYSKELQALVMMRLSDPRKGEAVFRLVNIHLDEPPASLFEVPSDYSIQEMKIPFPIPGNQPGRQTEKPPVSSPDKPD